MLVVDDVLVLEVDVDNIEGVGRLAKNFMLLPFFSVEVIIVGRVHIRPRSRLLCMSSSNM